MLDTSKARNSCVFLEKLLSELNSLSSQGNLLAIRQLIDFFFQALVSSLISRFIRDKEHILLHLIQDQTLRVLIISWMNTLNLESFSPEFSFSHKLPLESISRQNFLLLFVNQPVSELIVDVSAADCCFLNTFLDRVAIVDWSYSRRVVACLYNQGSGPSVCERSQDR